MKVKELIAMLEMMDPEATVLLGTQPSWPFEHRIAGVVERQEFDDCENLCPGEPQPNDVLICEGGQVRYGNADMFEC